MRFRPYGSQVGEDVVFEFPFLNLPEKAAKNVTRMLDTENMFIFSLCSRVCRKHVTSVYRPALRFLSVAIERRGLNFKIALNNQDIFVYIGYNRMNPPAPPYWIQVKFPNGEKHLRNPNWSHRELIRHFMRVFNQELVGFVSRESIISGVNLNYLCHIFKGSKFKDFQWSYPELTSERCRLINSILPKKFNPRCGLSTEVKRNLLIQHYESLSLYTPTKLNLDDLLVTNATELNYNGFWTDKDWNRFLKLWIGMANIRVKTLKFFYGGNQIDDDVFRGIPHRIMGPEESKEIVLDGESITVRNVRFILRKDGVEAMVSVYSRWHQFIFVVCDDES
ncbi:hypothetical protein CAEBREN_05068 [Caenorhabditis brenneri]|uniref:F-box domain-containing protein n=1 Tax=Caenorhabditis brenneri TaxID=135651 RepID=G0N3H6_CAEBE|nr:hypothetical protein CAEBREN_05068 [Caenorhabditis brenneri]